VGSCPSGTARRREEVLNPTHLTHRMVGMASSSGGRDHDEFMERRRTHLVFDEATSRYLRESLSPPAEEAALSAMKCGSRHARTHNGQLTRAKVIYTVSLEIVKTNSTRRCRAAKRRLKMKMNPKLHRQTLSFRAQTSIMCLL
jgi:hypothetical protein